MNNNKKEILFIYLQTEQLAFLWILLILIVVGNMAVLLALGMSSARKSRMNYFIKHLAIAGWAPLFLFIYEFAYFKRDKVNLSLFLSL